METKENPQTEEELRIINKTVELLKTVYDPEIPVNVYDLRVRRRISYLRMCVRNLSVSKALRKLIFVLFSNPNGIRI